MTSRSRFEWPLALATNVCLLVLGLIYIHYCRDGVIEYQHYIRGYSHDVLYQIRLYVVAALLVILGRPNRWTLPILLGVALAARLVGVFAPEFLSSDVYRYVWDGKVQGASINPYRYIPADEHLRFLRDREIYPHINRKEYAHTIYPPGAQLIFFAVTRISETEAFMKAAMVGFEAIACWAIIQALMLLGRRREEVLLYAWNPLCVWEIGSSGHLDAAVVALLSLAALMLLRGKTLRSACWVTAAAMVKMFPLVLLLGFGRRITRNIVVACTSIIVGGYALYASAGAGVLGFLPGFTHEEGLITGDRYFLLAWSHRYLRLPLWPLPYVAVTALVLSGLGLWGMTRLRSPEEILGLEVAISLVATILFSPHYPWYFLWILPIAVILRYLPAIVLALCAVYWFSTELAVPGETMFRLDKSMYGLFLLAVFLDLFIRWCRGTRLVPGLSNRYLGFALQPPSQNSGVSYE